MNASKVSRALVIASLVCFTISPATAAPPQIRTAPRPVIQQNPNAPRLPAHHPDPQGGSPPPALEQFTALSFIIKTGDDDLRSDSSAWLDLKFPDGSMQKCMVKNFDADSWGNGSTHDNDVHQCKLDKSRTFDELRKADIVLAYDGTSHAHAFETDDNWNVNEFRISALDIPNHNYPCILDVTGNPLVRMRNVSSTDYYKVEYASGTFDLSQSPSTC